MSSNENSFSKMKKKRKKSKFQKLLTQKTRIRSYRKMAELTHFIKRGKKITKTGLFYILILAIHWFPPKPLKSLSRNSGNFLPPPLVKSWNFTFPHISLSTKLHKHKILRNYNSKNYSRQI